MKQNGGRKIRSFEHSPHIGRGGVGVEGIFLLDKVIGFLLLSHL